jgi:hypothetical protein
MSTPRASAAAIRLADGRVLIEGGFRTAITGGLKSKVTTTFLATADIYNPSTGKFGKTGGMIASRQDQAVALLKDGRVLVVGGLGAKNAARNTIEMYNPAKGGFTAAAAMENARWHCTATTLQDGLVLIAGGFSGSVALDTALLYNP